MLGPTGGGLHVDFGFNLLTSFGLGEPGKQMAQGAIITLAAMADAARGARLGV